MRAIILSCYIYIMVFPLSISSIFAQTQEKGFISKETKDIAQSIGITNGTRWALLIGIANYLPSEMFDVQPLKSPVTDVDAIANFLKDKQKGGFKNENVFVLTNNEATKRNILINLNNISMKTTPEDMVIIYFSGHGYRPAGEDTTYLIPYDYDMIDPETTCINFDDLSKKIRKIEANKIILILDACHSGGIRPKGARSTGTSFGLVEKFTEAFQKAEGRYLLLSSDENEISWETDEGGIFTQFLLEGLNGRADTNEDGIVTFSEVALYVESKVPEYTRAKFPKVQNPVRRGDLGGQVRGDIPLAIDVTKINHINQDNLRKRRYEAIISNNLSNEIREFSLNIIKNAYDKNINNEELSVLESSFLADIDSLQASKISIDEFILRAKIFYEKIKGTPIKQSQIVEKKPIIEENKPTPTKVIDDNLQITELRNLGVGLYISYLKWGENDGDYSPPLEFGLKSNIRFTNYISAEMSAGYYHIFDKWWDEILLKNIESNISKFPIRATLIGHIPNKITSPFIGFGPTVIYGREKSNFYHDDNSYAHSENDQYIKYGGHILLGIDIPVMSYLTFSGSFGYEFINNYSAPMQFSLSIIYKLR
ncbi:TPA: caspase family protein [bacterium]|nr:caspase family protein [bacterium]